MARLNTQTTETTEGPCRRSVINDMVGTLPVAYPLTSDYGRDSMTAQTAKNPAIRTIMMPRDTNALGSIFGGHILSLIDLAAGQHARSVSPKKYVTKVMREVQFISPVYIGDAVSFYCDTMKVGRTSITVRVEVEATRGVDSLHTIPVTSAEVVMVAVDSNNRPIPIFDQV